MSDLAAAQARRLAGIDDLLPAHQPTPEGEWLGTDIRGREVGAVLYHDKHPRRGQRAVRTSAASLQVTPLLGDTGATGMAAVLDRLCARLSREPGWRDAHCVLAWPSHDVEVGGVLLARGFIPQHVLAVRGPQRPRPDPPGTGVRVRRARPGDEEELVALQLAELRYSATLASLSVAEDAADLIAEEVRAAVRTSGSMTWLAEDSSVAVGMADCTWTFAGPAATSSPTARLRAGRWGHVHSLSVTPHARGRGVGRALMAAAHRTMTAPDVAGVFLYYNVVNPLAPAFWHNQEYRPLWTFWEIQPAAALEDRRG